MHHSENGGKARTGRYFKENRQNGRDGRDGKGGKDHEDSKDRRSAEGNKTTSNWKIPGISTYHERMRKNSVHPAYTGTPACRKAGVDANAR